MKLKKLLSMLLVLCMVLSLVPATAFHAHAAVSASGMPGIRTIAALQHNVGTGSAPTLVYFGNGALDEVTNSWYVVGYNDGTTKVGKAENVPDTKAVYLASVNLHGTTVFGNSNTYYVDSELKKLIDAVEADFSAAESAAITPRTFTVTRGQYNAGVANVDGAPALTVNLWAPSYQEISNLSNAASKYCGASYWLRSASATNPSYVNASSGLSGWNTAQISETHSVRAAMYLNLDNVLMVSVVGGSDGVGGKYAGRNGVAKLTTFSGTNARLTLLDAARTFAVSASAVKDGVVSIAYTGALTGDNEYISMLIADNTTGLYSHYGRIKAEAAEGTMSFDLSALTLPADYTMYVFNEQYNGNASDNLGATDYASAFVAIEPVEGELPSGEPTCDHAEDKLTTTEEVTKPATCKEAGTKTVTYTCECGEYTNVVEGVEIQKTNDHTPGKAADCDEDQTCTVCGEVLNEKLGHTPGKAADCDEDQTCTVCGEVLTEKLGHTPGKAADCDEDQTCTVCGEVLTEKLGHTPGKAADCDEDQTCTVCGEVLNEKLGHTPGKEADCDEDQTCTVCGEVLNEKLGHDFATDLTAGETTHYYECSRCDEIDSEAAHEYDNQFDAICDACGKDRVAAEIVATINGTPYASLDEAIQNAVDDDKIVLEQSVSGPGLKIDKDITIDFGGNTYTFTDPATGSVGTTTLGMQILKNNNVTLKNGTLKVDAAYEKSYAVLIQNYANLTISGMTLDGTQLDRFNGYDYSHVVSVNCGTVLIENTTIIANDEGEDVALTLDQYASYAVPTVTLNNVTVDDGIIKINGANVVINSGTYTGNGSNGLICIESGSLEINGGTFDAALGADNYSMALWAKGGNTVINGGTFKNATDGSDRGTDLIYAKFNGQIEITGGTFEAAKPEWTLNLHDDYRDTASIVVKGGKFLSFDPSNGIPEGIPTNFLADKTEHTKLDGEYYVICDDDAQAPKQENVVDSTCTEVGSYDEVVYCACGKELSRETKEIAVKAAPTIALDGTTVTLTDEDDVFVQMGVTYLGVNSGVENVTSWGGFIGLGGKTLSGKAGYTNLAAAETVTLVENGDYVFYVTYKNGEKNTMYFQVVTVTAANNTPDFTIDGTAAALNANNNTIVQSGVKYVGANSNVDIADVTSWGDFAALAGKTLEGKAGYTNLGTATTATLTQNGDYVFYVIYTDTYGTKTVFIKKTVEIENDKPAISLDGNNAALVDYGFTIVQSGVKYMGEDSNVDIADVTSWGDFAALEGKALNGRTGYTNLGKATEATLANAGDYVFYVIYKDATDVTRTIFYMVTV